MSQGSTQEYRDTAGNSWRIRIPKRFENSTVGNFNGHDKIVEKCLSAAMDGESIYLHGACGTGKTHLACALMSKILQHKFENGIKLDAMFLPSVELFLELKNSFNNDGASEMEILYKYSFLSTLVIDDIGVEKVSDWSRQVFYTLIDRRYRDKRQTIFTSNLNLDELSKTIDDRIASRIVEMGIVVDLGKEDYRLKI